MPIKIDPKKCSKEHECPAAASCPALALVQKEKGQAPEIDTAKCLECQLCAAVCPNGAITFE